MFGSTFKTHRRLPFCLRAKIGEVLKAEIFVLFIVASFQAHFSFLAATKRRRLDRMLLILFFNIYLFYVYLQTFEQLHLGPIVHCFVFLVVFAEWLKWRLVPLHWLPVGVKCTSRAILIGEHLARRVKAVVFTNCKESSFHWNPQEILLRAPQFNIKTIYLGLYLIILVLIIIFFTRLALLPLPLFLRLEVSSVLSARLVP